jgi:hypothetical protein
LFAKKACPMCQGLQCPCPPNSALLPSLPTITPPHIVPAGMPVPAVVEPLPEFPSGPEEVPLTPETDDEVSALDSNPSHSAVVR